MGTSTLDKILMGENSESKRPRYAPPAVFPEAEDGTKTAGLGKGQSVQPLAPQPVADVKAEANKPTPEVDKMPMAAKRGNVVQPSSEVAEQSGQEAPTGQQAMTNAAAETQGGNPAEGDITVPKRISLAELYRKLNPQPTDEEVRKQQKKEKRDKLFASISDGISALANLFYTTKYAPNSFDPNKSQSKQMKDRYDKLKAERDAEKQAYVNALLQAEMKDNDHAIADAQAALARKRQAQKDAENKEKADREAKRKDDKAKADENYRKAQLKLAEGRQKEQARHNRAMENKPSGRSGSGSGNSYPLFNKNTGKWENYKNEKTWIAKYTEIYGKLPAKVSTSVTDNSDMFNPRKTTTSSEDVASYIGRQNALHEQEWKKSRSNGGGKAASTPPTGKGEKPQYSHTKALGL